MGIRVQLVTKNNPKEVVGAISLRGAEIDIVSEEPEIRSSVSDLLKKYVPVFQEGSRASQKVQDAARVLGFFRVLDLLKVAGLGIKAEQPTWLGGKTKGAKGQAHSFEKMMQNKRFRERLRPAVSGEVTFGEAIKQYMREDSSEEERRLYDRAFVHLGLI